MTQDTDTIQRIDETEEKGNREISTWHLDIAIQAVKNSLIRFLQKNNFCDARSAGEALKILLTLQKTPSYPAKHKEED